jgi:surface polysaccharide O-acyltransferase-like enzyme
MVPLFECQTANPASWFETPPRGSPNRLCYDAMQKQAYGIYLLHFIPLIWLQYLVTDPPLLAVVKSAIVFVGTLSTSWLATMGLRRIPLIARMI